MNVIPVINCADIECVRKKLAIAKTFLPDGAVVHLDVTDGVFAAHKTWAESLAWTGLASPFGLEVHLMVAHPEDYVDDWCAAGARRLIVHVESLTPQSAHEIHSLAEQYRATVMLSSKPETTVEEFSAHIHSSDIFSRDAFQVLAVHPGPAGQKFLPFVTEKIKFLRTEAPDAIIEVDGGMDMETARMVRAAGADTIVSSSAIFDSVDPKKAYEALCAI